MILQKMSYAVFKNQFHPHAGLPMNQPDIHKQRREEVARAASRIILSSGIEAVTARGVARETGFSTAIVSHYFTDKTEMMLFIYRHAALQTGRRLSIVRKKAASTFLDVLYAALPLNERRRLDWSVYLAFWGRCVSDPVFAAEQRRMVDYFRDAIVEQFVKAPPANLNRPPEQHAQALLTFVMGLATQATVDPASWPAKRQKAVLLAELREQNYPV